VVLQGQKQQTLAVAAVPLLACRTNWPPLPPLPVAPLQTMSSMDAPAESWRAMFHVFVKVLTEDA
jgi:hypothetical protein